MNDSSPPKREGLLDILNFINLSGWTGAALRR
jgi:hypothetical protein